MILSVSIKAPLVAWPLADVQLDGEIIMFTMELSQIWLVFIFHPPR